MHIESGEHRGESIEALKQRVAELERENEKLREQAERDGLTGLYSRVAGADRGETLLNAIRSAERPERRKREENIGFTKISAVMIDIDRFKSVNDSLGHQAGDIVLKEIAKVIRDCIRADDIAFRYGGEEMALLLPGASETDAHVKADALREMISNMEFPDYPDFRVTVSMGVSSSEDGGSLDEIIGRADRALYKAKEDGRNRVCSHSEKQSEQVEA